MKYRYEVPGDDFSRAGEASREFKRVLARLGVAQDIVKRAAIAMCEGEINMAIHAGGGVAEAAIEPGLITLVLRDEGPGIPDVALAMREGYSTAPEWIRSLGYGAGMGLPNMKRSSDELSIDTAVGRGTTVTMRFRIPA